MRPKYYILVGQTPVPCDHLTWAHWFENSYEDGSRVVKQEDVMDICWVSTVFLGLDHSFGSGPPLLFETMARWSNGDWYEQKRCSSWLEAERQHQRVLREVVKPSAVLAWVRRSIRDTIWEAREDARRSWRELRGIQPTEIELLTERMERMQERLRSD